MSCYFPTMRAKPVEIDKLEMNLSVLCAFAKLEVVSLTLVNVQTQTYLNNVG